MEKQLVSVIVCAFNAEKTVRETINSVLNQSEKPLELIVVNDGSTDNTQSILEEFKNKIKIIQNKKNLGIATARNIGIKNSTGKFIAFLDSDCRAEKNWLSELLKGFESERTASVGGLSPTHPQDKRKAKAIGSVLALFSGLGSEYSRKATGIVSVKHNPSCNSMYLRNVLLELNGFNESLKSNEDPELDYRIKKKGLELKMNPGAVVLHHRRTSFKAFFKQAFWFGSGRMQAIKLHPGMAEWFRLVPSIYLIALFLSVMFYPLISLALAGLLLSMAAIASLWLSLKSHEPLIYDYFTAIMSWFFGYGFGFIYGLAK